MPRKLPDWIEGFMELTEENSEAPKLFRYWTAVSCVASALQRKTYVSLGMLTFYPNMYIILCAPSGVRKGTAMGPGYDLLNDIGVKMSAQATTLQALIRHLKNTTHNEICPVTGKIMMHSSLTIFSKEFTVFLGYRNQELMSHLCDWYDCENRWTYETVGRGKEEIIGVWVNLIGATTPDLIQTSMPVEAIGGGLTSRMIIVYEMRKGKFVPFPMLTPEEIKLRELLKEDLERIALLTGKFKFEKEYIDSWIDWRAAAEENPPKFNDTRFNGYTQRRPAHLIKLSMIMSASRGGDLVLRRTDLEHAVVALNEVERNMGRVFSGLGQSDIAKLIPRVLAWLHNKKKTDMAELMREFYYDADVWTMERVLKSLEMQEKLTRVITDKGTKIFFNLDGMS